LTKLKSYIIGSGMGDLDLYPIRYVSRQTGLTPHAIRAWENRYGAVKPKRTKTNWRII
jgi:hypothetical protein